MFVNRVISIGAAAILSVGSALAADPVQSVSPTAPAAESANSAIVSLWLGGILVQTDDGDFEKDSIFTAGGDARAYIEMAASWGLQMELAALYEGHADDGGEDQPTAHIIAGLHAISRGANFDWGGFAAVSHTQHNDENDSSEHFIGGLEAAIVRGMTQYFGQIGGHAAISGDTDDTWDAGAFATLGARHFFSDTSVLKGSASIGGFGTFEDAPDAIWGQWLVEYERQLDSSPLSFFAAYQGDMLNENGDSDWDDNMINHAFKLGMRASIGGGGTIYSLAHDGAGTFSLPDIHMPFSYTDDLW